MNEEILKVHLRINIKSHKFFLNFIRCRNLLNLSETELYFFGGRIQSFNYKKHYGNKTHFWDGRWHNIPEDFPF